MNQFHQPLEQKLSEAARDHWLRERHKVRDWNGLLEGALLLNTLYHMERTKTQWAIREAATNLPSAYGLDRDSA